MCAGPAVYIVEIVSPLVRTSSPAQASTTVLYTSSEVRLQALHCSWAHACLGLLSRDVSFALLAVTRGRRALRCSSPKSPPSCTLPCPASMSPKGPSCTPASPSLRPADSASPLPLGPVPFAAPPQLHPITFPARLQPLPHFDPPSLRCVAQCSEIHLPTPCGIAGLSVSPLARFCSQCFSSSVISRRILS